MGLLTLETLTYQTLYMYVTSFSMAYGAGDCCSPVVQPRADRVVFTPKAITVCGHPLSVQHWWQVYFLDRGKMGCNTVSGGTIFT